MGGCAGVREVRPWTAAVRQVHGPCERGELVTLVKADEAAVRSAATASQIGSGTAVAQADDLAATSAAGFEYPHVEYGRAPEDPPLVAGQGAPVSRRDTARRRVLACVDAISLAAAYGCMCLVASPSDPAGGAIVLAGALPLWALFNKLLRLYDRDANLIHKSTLDELPQIGLSVLLGTGLIYGFGPSVTGVELSREDAILFIGLALVLMPTVRGLTRVAIGRRYPPERCLIVGSGFVAGLLARKIAAHPEYRVELMGCVDVATPGLEQNGGTRLLGGIERFKDLCHKHDVERVVIAFSRLSHEDLIQVVRTSKNLNLKISVVPRLFEVIGHSVEVDQLEGMTLLGLRGFARTQSSLMLKRAIDLVGASVGLVLLSPFLVVIAASIKLTSRGPVLFSQRRIGRGTQPFQLYKFRTMVHGADDLKPSLAHLNEVEHPMFKVADDPRITRVGAHLRRLSLDELPQLWNVVKGEMSLVGPRPLVPSEDDQVIGRHRERLDLVPGLTGPWQVLGRTAIPFQEMIKLDYLYVAEWSLWNDIKLMLRTVPVILRARGR